jgi:hypothetical protein
VLSVSRWVRPSSLTSWTASSDCWVTPHPRHGPTSRTCRTGMKTPTTCAPSAPSIPRRRLLQQQWTLLRQQ